MKNVPSYLFSKYFFFILYHVRVDVGAVVDWWVNLLGYYIFTFCGGINNFILFLEKISLGID